MKAEICLERQALFVCAQLHAAIDTAFVTEQIIRQYLEPITQDEQLPELKLDDFAVFFCKIFFSHI